MTRKAVRKRVKAQKSANRLFETYSQLIESRPVNEQELKVTTRKLKKADYRWKNAVSLQFKTSRW